METKKAKEAFRFYTRMHLSALTGLKAANLRELVLHIREVPGSSIYHHTHRFLQQHQHLSPEPPNDFAYWVREVLGEEGLAEYLDSIDIMQFSSLRDLRDKIVDTIELFLQENPAADKKSACKGEEFIFIRSVSFIAPTNYAATDLAEFVDILKKITVDSVYFHMFESRLRLEKATNDFSNWFAHSLDDSKLAKKISAFDPYTLTLEDLRTKIIEIVSERIPDNASY